MQNQNDRDNQNKLNLLNQMEQVGYNKDHQSSQIMILSNKSQQYKINKNIIAFSKLLEFTFEDEQDQDQDDILNFLIPQEIPINQLHISAIQNFMKACMQDPHRLKIKKVEAYYWKGDQQCMKEIRQFIEQNLKQMDLQKMKQLISLCRYLQINSLLDVIYYHLANKYSVSYSMKISQQQLEKYQVKKMNEQQMTEMKLKYFDYFHKLSSQYKDIKQERQKIKEEIENKIQNNIQSLIQQSSD